MDGRDQSDREEIKGQNTMSKAIEPVKQSLEEYKLDIDTAEIREIILENVGGEGITVNKLDRFVNPSTTGTQWEVPSLVGGPELTGEIEGILVFHKLSRARWDGPYKGGGESPLCSARNGFTGEGDPGGDCKDCPYAKFTEDSKGESVKPECRIVKQLFIRLPGALLPTVMNCSATNIPNIERYLFKLTNKLVKYYHVVTKVTCETDTSKSGFKYPKFHFEATSFVPEDQKKDLSDYNKFIKPMLLEVELTDADVATADQPDW